MFQVAADVLPTPASSVPSERVFSSGKETDTLRRSGLDTALFEILQVLKYSLKHRYLERVDGGLVAREADLRARDIVIPAEEAHKLLENGNAHELRRLLNETI